MYTTCMIQQISRRLLPVVEQRFAETPVLLLEGPRSVGKSTLLQDFARAHPDARLFDFDDGEVSMLAQ